MRHILIGGAGFLGQEVARKLIERRYADDNGDEIVIVDIDTQELDAAIINAPFVSIYKADISEPNSLNDLQIHPENTVHHLASRLITPNEPRFNRYDFFARTSIIGTQNVLAWMKDCACSSLVFWSTDMVYGNAHQPPVTEMHVPQPLGPYGKTKVVAENMIFEAIKNQGLRCSIFRPRLIIGPNRLGILEKLFNAASSNMPIPMIGNGQNRFQFVSVSDCARASILAADHCCPNGIFNLGSACPPKIKDLLRDFVDHVGSRSFVVPTPGLVVKIVLEILNFLKISPMDPEQFRIADKDTFVDFHRAKNILGWLPEDNDLSMLIAAYETYKANLTRRS